MLDAEFVVAAAKPEMFPVSTLPEVAFLGRSNVGKSSLLNCLVARPGLARTSSRPGCTQAVQFYRVQHKIHLVDLPGYGYAEVSLPQKTRWKKLIESYLVGRSNLALSIMVLDARRGWTPMDLELRRWLEFHNRPTLAVATKVDKLKTQKERNQSMAALREGSLGSEVLLFSAVTGQGVREIWQAIWKTKDRQG
jgi:GTP-binding protein